MKQKLTLLCSFICLLSCLSLLLTFKASAQDVKGNYILGPRDVISVAIFAGGEEQVAVDLTVTGQGMVNFPFLGSFSASGLTCNELEKAVIAPLGKEYFVKPEVHIKIKEYHSLNFSISGAVNKPGKYKMEGATTILDLIAQAEGVTMERGNIAYILRSSKENQDKVSDTSTDPLKINLVDLLDKGNMSENMLLMSGDSVYIPTSQGLNQAESKVYVSGEVEKPDIYDYQPGLTALSVCIMAGGFAKYAAPNRATIVRNEDGKQVIIKINLEEVIKGKVPDIALKPGDRINIPESWL